MICNIFISVRPGIQQFTHRVGGDWENTDFLLSKLQFKAKKTHKKLDHKYNIIDQ